jgi:ubiquinone/menaquinone biosynthesis C-methylase UbiE
MHGSGTVDEARAIERNIRVHDRISRDYEGRHAEIFNEIEQTRLSAALASAAAEIKTDSSPKRALDLGCGSGNLTGCLIVMGMQTVSADVSSGFLELITQKFGTSGLSETAHLNGRDLSQFKSGTFDFVATYSVLHHVPDYLGIVREMCRVLAPGGVLYIDHEYNDEFWRGPPAKYRELQAEAAGPRWKRILRPRNYLNLLRPKWYLARYRRLKDPRYSEEGDIHVWPDDHVEWSAIERVLEESDVTVVKRDNYLLYRAHYTKELYERYRSQCTDVGLLVGRKTV